MTRWRSTYWTNRQAVEAAELPESLIVLGGGAIGLELAQVYARFGVSVSVVEALDRLMPMEEPEVSALVRTALQADGITVHTGVRVRRVDHTTATNSTSRSTAGRRWPDSGCWWPPVDAPT